MGIVATDKRTANPSSMLDYSGERAYTAIAQEVPSSGIELNNPIRSVPDDFRHIPEAGTLTWQDDFFDDDDVVAVFDFDYEKMESFITQVKWAELACSSLHPPFFVSLLLSCTPCFLKKRVQWDVYAQHAAITRDGIRFVRDRRRTCCGLACSDAGRSSKTVPFDKITDCDIEEPAGNTCFCIANVLSTVNIDTASSNSMKHELQIIGLKNPHEFKKLVWAMKRARGNSSPRAMEMEERCGSGNSQISNLLREIRDELRANNALLQAVKVQEVPLADLPPSTEFEPESV